jgi:predicted small lipoprotein YifL
MEHAVAAARHSPSIALAVVVIAALGLAGCGRAGPEELPPSAAAPPPQTSNAAPVSPVAPDTAVPGTLGDQTAAAQQAAVKNGFDSHGNPVAAPGEKKDFFLDFLLK